MPARLRPHVRVRTRTCETCLFSLIRLCVHLSVHTYVYNILFHSTIPTHFNEFKKVQKSSPWYFLETFIISVVNKSDIWRP